jgi:hypothetical protein
MTTLRTPLDFGEHVTDPKAVFPEHTYLITPDGKQYELDSSDYKFILSEDGFGMPPIDYITGQSPTQHGTTIFDYRLKSRIVQLVYRSRGRDRFDYWNNRDNLLEILRPNQLVSGAMAPLILRRSLPNGKMRDLEVFIDQGPGFAARDLSEWDEWSFTETLRFIAPNPLFKNPIVSTQALTFAATAGFTFPMTLPLYIDDDILQDTLTCTYGGNFETFPTIILHGPMSGCEITNNFNGKRINLLYVVSFDETLTIYLNQNNKKAISSKSGDVSGILYLSDLTMFKLFPHPTVVGGANTFDILASGVSVAGGSAVTFQWNELDIGI